jgi:mediator of replication checkpoint protein 1
MASRMQARNTNPEESESEVEENADTPRAASPRKSSDDVHSAASQDNMDDEDEDVVTTRPRRLKSRRERNSTPETRPAEEAANSPGLFVSPNKDAPESPGLFVSPFKPQSLPAEQSDDDLPSPTALTKNPRFKALVAKKRQERLAREAEEARKKAERLKAAGRNEDDLMVEDDEDDNITDDEGGRKLTQEVAATRPPRKASKKAIEEMNRETQRLTRSLQLGYEAKVRKKITKATLFERFNFKPEGAAAPAEKAVPATSSSRAPTPGSAAQSDAEMKDAETPPSSPPPLGKEGISEGAAPPAADTTTLNDEDDFPTLEEMVQEAAARKKLDKGKGKATAADLQAPPTAAPPKKRNFRLKIPALQANPATLSLDDDDDLQIIPTRKSKLDALFDRIPLNQAKASRPLQLLRRLAHLDDPDKQAAPPSRAGNKLQKQHPETVMTAGQLQASLLQRARQQAKLERDRHLEMLRAKGVHVQTAEEREREMQDVEDIVAKARKEAEEIMEREREAAKAERKRRRLEGGEEEDALGWDDSEDEEYEEEEDREVEKEVELSGSEEEEEDGEEGEENEEGGVLIDDAAESAEESETEDAGEQPERGDSDEELPSSKQVRRRPRKQVTIVSDDEEETEPQVKATPRPKAHFPKSPSVRNAESPSVPTSVLRSATKTFIPGLPVAGPAGLGLTQIFAGTMDDSQMGATQASPSQPRPTFDVTVFPDSNFSQTAQEAPEDMILDSQPARETQQPETQGVQIRFSQSQMHGFDTFLQQSESFTQASELIEPTQDVGFRNFSPLRQRFVEPPVSTADTLPVGQTQATEQNESPLVRRIGKLRRRAEVVPASPTRGAAPDGEDEAMEDEFDFGTVSNNAFAAMKEAALKEKKRKEAFDKKKSRAREMIEEQAEESEDEYAGLGGADGEDSDDEDDQSVKEMIDDETKENEEDERKLAAFYA